MTYPVLHMQEFFASRAGAVAALSGAAFTATGGDGMPAIFWPFVGIVLILGIAVVLSRVVRGDPYYDQNASKDRRDAGPVFPWNDGGNN